MSPTRRLAAILVADVAGYSRLMEADEAGTLAALRERRKNVLEPVVARHHGRVVKVMGDGVLVEFASAVNAVACAVDLQKQFAAANEGVAEDRRIVLRVGVNLGDVVVEGGDLYGDGVIIAVRLQAMAEPGGICISGSVHEQVAGKIDATFDDLGPCEVKNSSKPVRVYRLRFSQMPAAATVAPTSALAIAVLPFENMSGDPSQQYISDGITEDIITGLSRFKNLAVAARHASFHYRGKDASLAQVTRELGVSYAVEGSVRKTGERIRVTAQLIESRSGNHVWAERYDSDTRDVFAMQDEVVAAIVATLEGRLVVASAAAARRKPTANWNAYDCLLQGRELANEYREAEAIPYFSRAAEIDPQYALAHAWLAIARTVKYVGTSDRRLLDDAAADAAKALALDNNDPNVLWATAMVMMWSARLAEAGRYFERALALNPADTQIRADRATWLRFCGKLNEALAAIDDALKQGPFAPHWFWVVRGEVLFEMQEYRGAIAAFGNLPHKKVRALIYLAAAHAHIGDLASARSIMAEASRRQPDIPLISAISARPYAVAPHPDQLLEGMRMAGLPE